MLKELRKLAYLSVALVAMSYASNPASAATSFTSAGACDGSLGFVSGTSGADCVTTTGHISASVVGTLTINEVRAISFGNMAAPCGGAACAGLTDAATVVLDPVTGQRTAATGGTDAIVLMHGNAANTGSTTGGAGLNPGALQSGGQGVGILSISNAAEGGATQVYISFADTTGLPVDFAGEDYWTANDGAIRVSNAGATAYFTVKDFQISCTGGASDVYGHFCDNATLPLQVKVGATLTTVAAQTYTVGKYTGTYNAMVSY